MARKTISRSLESLSGWEKLDSKEQEYLRQEDRDLAQCIQLEGAGRLGIGEHLCNIEPVLKKARMLGEYLKRFRFSQASAYRYMELYQRNRGKLPESVLNVAVALKYDSLNLNAVERNPPPKGDDTQEIVRYLDSIKKKKAPSTPKPLIEVLPPEGNADIILRECINFVELRYERLPRSHKTRQAWREEFIGILLTKWGMSSPQTFNPIAIPAELRTSKTKGKVA